MSQLQNMVELGLRIDQYMENSPPPYTKTSLSEIEELSSYEWPSLATDIKFGKLELRTMGPAPMSFQVIASPEQKRAHKLFNILSFISVLVSIGLAVVFSWWWLALLVLFPVFRGAAKAAYNDAILSSAICSEQGFSFLFSRGAICLLGEDGLIFSKAE